MEARLRRLVLLVAAAFFLGFGIASAYSYYKARSALSSSELYDARIDKALIGCHEGKDAGFCDLLEMYRKFRQEALDEGLSYDQEFDRYIVWTLVAPLITMLLFFALRWVVTGQAPKIPTRVKAISTDAESANTIFAAEGTSWRYVILIAIVSVVLLQLINYMDNSSKEKPNNIASGRQSALPANQEIRVLVSSQDAEGVIQSQLNLDILKNLEAHAVQRIKAIMKERGVVLSQSEITSEAGYVESGPYKFAVIRLRFSDGSSAVFVNAIIGREFKRVACIRKSTEPIPVTFGPCGEKIKEVFGVGI